MTDTDLEFCQALEEGIDAARVVVVRFVALLASRRTYEDPSFEQQISDLAEWLRGTPCIESVSVHSGILKTAPPQKVLSLAVIVNQQRRTLRLKLRLGRDLEVVALEP